MTLGQQQRDYCPVEDRALPRFCRVAVACVLSVWLTGCGGQSVVEDKSDFQPRPGRNVLRAPVPPEPLPKAGAEMRAVEEQKSLSSISGLHSVHLSKEGSEIEIDLRRAPTLQMPGFESGAVTGPRGFEERILADLEKHPQFLTPLRAVLREAAAEDFSGLSLSVRNRAQIRRLLDVVDRF